MVCVLCNGDLSYGDLDDDDDDLSDVKPGEGVLSE